MRPNIDKPFSRTDILFDMLFEHSSIKIIMHLHLFLYHFIYSQYNALCAHALFLSVKA